MEDDVCGTNCSVPFVSGNGEMDNVSSQHGVVPHLVLVGVGEVGDPGEGGGGMKEVRRGERGILTKSS